MIGHTLILAFTGHRPQKLGGYDRNNPLNLAIKQAMKREIEKLDPCVCISGMALGVDTMAAELCIEMQIPWIAAVPFGSLLGNKLPTGQELVWNKEDQEHYQFLLTKAWLIEIVSEGGYSPAKLQIRNEWMVDHAGGLLAVWDGTKGGTGNCVAYAESKGLPLYRIDPTKILASKNE